MKRTIALLLLCCLVALPAFADNVVLGWNDRNDFQMMEIGLEHPGGHGALFPGEVVQALGQAKDDAGKLRIRFFSPVGEPIPALVPANAIRRMDAGSTARLAIVNNPDPADRLHLRLNHDKDSMSRGRYYNGVVLQVLETRRDGWVKVNLQGFEGWMMSDYLLFNEMPGAVPLATPTATLQGRNPNGVQLRAGQYEGSYLGRYENGMQVPVLGVSGNWAHVYVPEGFTGFMPLDELKVEGGLR